MITKFLMSFGLTRDSWWWFVGRLVSGATLVLTAGPLGLLDPYVGQEQQKWLVVIAVIIMWLAGKYDTSPLPGKPWDGKDRRGDSNERMGPPVGK